MKMKVHEVHENIMILLVDEREQGDRETGSEEVLLPGKENKIHCWFPEHMKANKQTDWRVGWISWKMSYLLYLWLSFDSSSFVTIIIIRMITQDSERQRHEPDDDCDDDDDNDD